MQNAHQGKIQHGLTFRKRSIVASTERQDPRLHGLRSTEAGQRRTYRKPQVLYSETLEAVAADCSIPGGKGDPTCIVGFS